MRAGIAHTGWTQGQSFISNHDAFFITWGFISRNPANFTIGLNDGLAASHTVPHAYVHVIPRGPAKCQTRAVASDMADRRKAGVRHYR
jgi:hypothetical protein